MRKGVIVGSVVLICVTVAVSTAAVSAQSVANEAGTGQEVLDDHDSQDWMRNDTGETDNSTRQVPDFIRPGDDVRPSVGASTGREYDASVTYDLLPGKPGRMEMAVDYTVSSGEQGPWHTVDDSTVIHTAEGFSVENRSYGRVLEHDGTTPDPRLVIEFEGNATRYGSYYDFVVTDDWALISNPIHFDSDNITYDATKPVTVSPDGWAFVGEHDVRRFSPLQNQTISLVVPEAASLTASESDIEATLTGAARSLSIGEVDPEVTAFAAPKPIRSGGLAFGSSFWTSADSKVNKAGNTWIHEYVHTRQSFSTTRNTSWVTEGMATYYGAYLTYLQGRVSFSSYSDRIGGLSKANRETVLMSQNSSRDAGYGKGSTALARLNEWISDTSSNGQGPASAARLQDAATRWNEVGQVDSSTLYHSLNATANASVTTEIREFLETAKPVGPPRLDGTPPIYPRVRNVSLNVRAPNVTGDSVVATRAGVHVIPVLNYDILPHVSRSRLDSDGKAELPVEESVSDQTLVYINDRNSTSLPDFYPIATATNGSVVQKNTAIPEGYPVNVSVVANNGTPLTTDASVGIEMRNGETSYEMERIQIRENGSTSVASYRGDQWPSNRLLRLGGDVNLSVTHNGGYRSGYRDVPVELTGPTLVQFVLNRSLSEVSQTVVHDTEPEVGETVQFTTYSRQSGVTSISVDGKVVASKQRERIEEARFSPDRYRANITLTFDSSGAHTVQVNDDPPFTVHVASEAEVDVSAVGDSVTQGETAGVTTSLSTSNSRSTTTRVELRYNGTTVGIENVTVSGTGTEQVQFDIDTAGLAPGNYTYEVVAGNETETITLTVERALDPLPGESDPPIDIDGDGLLEDIDGDGTVTIDDVLTYYGNRERDVIRNNTQRFDFDGDGVAGTVADALALNEEANSQ